MPGVITRKQLERGKTRATRSRLGFSFASDCLLMGWRTFSEPVIKGRKTKPWSSRINSTLRYKQFSATDHLADVLFITHPLLASARVYNPTHFLLFYFFLNSVNAKVPFNWHNTVIRLYPSIITETTTSRAIISYFLLVANIGQYK